MNRWQERVKFALRQERNWRKKAMIVKLVIPVSLTLATTQESRSDAIGSSAQHLWIKEFPRCFHEKENIMESWQALEIVLMRVTGHEGSRVTACYQVNQNICLPLVLAENTLFSVFEKGETEPVEYDYFAAGYQDHLWLMVYCRKCNTIFQACGL